MFTKLFWQDAIERVVATAAQAILALTAGNEINLVNVDVKHMLLIGAYAALFALLKALAAARFAGGNSASFTVTNVE